MKELHLLSVLVQNDERAFSKKELFENVWSENKAREDELHTVTVYIKSLRQQLNAPVKDPCYIQTVLEKGYQFIGGPL